MDKICNIFLKLKHWQLFLIWAIGSIQMQIFIKTDFWLLSFLIYYSIIFGWIYSIGKVLNNDNTLTTKKLNIWSLVHFLSMIPFALNFRNFYFESSDILNLFSEVVFGLLIVFSIFQVTNISAKSLKIKITKQKVIFKDYAVEFFLILYLIIGVWFLQPKLNEIIDEK